MKASEYPFYFGGLKLAFFYGGFMATVEMRRYSKPATESAVERQYEYGIDLAAPGATDWILVPMLKQNVSVMIDVAGGGEGYIEVTVDLLSVLEDDPNNAIKKVWPQGTINSLTEAVFYHIKALRMVNTAGTTKLRVMA
jgi:hypothetical protein